MTPDWSCMILRPKWTFYYLERLSLYDLSHQKKKFEKSLKFHSRDKITEWICGRNTEQSMAGFCLLLQQQLLEIATTQRNQCMLVPFFVVFFFFFFFACIHSVKTKLVSCYIGYSVCFPSTFPHVFLKSLKNSDPS